MTGLAKEFDTTFLTFDHHPQSPDGSCDREELEGLMPGVRIVTARGLGPGRRRLQARLLLSRRSWTFGRYLLPEFGEALSATMRRARPAILHLDDLGVGQVGPLPSTLTVFAPHNVEHRIAKGEAHVARGVRRAFAEVEWRKLAREEARLWRTMPLCLAVSGVDAQAMRAAGASRVEVCPNGADPVSQLPPPQRGPEGAFRLLFLGSCNYRPYERGLAWLVSRVLPRLRERMSVAFDVVGQPPNRPMLAEGVRYVGPVPSVAPWYEQADAVVVPVFEGSGTRLKIVEAMAYGRPVISTTLGAQGLPVEAGVHYVRADDEDEFARALLTVAQWCQARHPALRRMLDSARSAAERLFWPRIVNDLVTIYRRELERQQLVRPDAVLGSDAPLIHRRT